MVSSVTSLYLSVGRASAIPVFFLLFILASNLHAAEKRFDGLDGLTRIQLGQPIMGGSIQVTRNGDTLKLGTDFSIEASAGVINLAKPLTNQDSLKISFTPIPDWLQSFGRPIPEQKQSNPVTQRLPSSNRDVSNRSKSDISLTGAKSFRISSRSSGPADFSQTLDLQISGQLTDRLTIQGNVSDRDVDPAYGTLNSRLSELDRMNIRVFSNRFEAELGDLTRPRWSGTTSSRQMTGLAVKSDQPRWSVNGTIARPKGEYSSVALTGKDGLQGPYRTDLGGRSTPIVPGSESVWLDGELLERGTDKDYQIDYSQGQITFNVNHPIDSRSRIEIDFEPQTFEYKKELYSGGGELYGKDSVLFFGFQAIREGDDKSQPLVGELSEADLELLSNAGDNDVWRSAVTPDTSGQYLLVIDSLPDSVFVWVESGGEYSIGFSYVGTGQGAYRSLGNGVYEHVGVGEGEYLPLRVLQAPARSSQYYLQAGLNQPSIGRVRVDWSSSVYDQNLFSDFDDENNRADLYEITGSRDWKRSGRNERLELGYRLREKDYLARKRLNRADFGREYFVPSGIASLADERWIRSSLELEPTKGQRLSSGMSRLEYLDQFNSDLVQIKLNSVWSTSLSSELRFDHAGAVLDSGSGELDGKRTNFRSSAIWKPGSDWQIAGGWERDSRENEFTGSAKGTRYTRSTVNLSRSTESIRYENYIEDSLVGDWIEQVQRHRLSLSSNRKYRRLGYNFIFSRQWLNEIDREQANFLGRLNLRYDSPVDGISGTANYLLTEELKNARGITYLQVAPGEGDYILDETAPGGPQYIPDDQGDYIRLEEVLSAAEQVKQGERSFLFSRGGSGWQLRFDSRHQEELLADSERPWWWVVPFLADESGRYLFFSGRHNLDLRLIERSGFHLINLTGSRQLERRLIGDQSPIKEALNGELVTKEKVGRLFLEQGLRLFRTRRDAYYSGIGKVDGHRVRLAGQWQFEEGRFGLAGGRRVAESDANERVVTWLAELTGRLAVLGRGQARLKLEWYTHQFTNLTQAASYQLTDNRPGNRGAIWTAGVQYGLGSDLKLNLSLSGRHSDNRHGRVLARGELIATF